MLSFLVLFPSSSIHDFPYDLQGVDIFYLNKSFIAIVMKSKPSCIVGGSGKW